MLELKRPKQTPFTEEQMSSSRATPIAVPTPVPTPGLAADVAKSKPPPQAARPQPTTRPVNPTVEYDFQPSAKSVAPSRSAMPANPPVGGSGGVQLTEPLGGGGGGPMPVRPPSGGSGGVQLTEPLTGTPQGGGSPSGGTTATPPGTTPPAYTAPNLAGVNPLGRSRVMDWRQGFAETRRDATTRQVNPNELTSDQLSRLLDENGRYIQSARLRAREGAAGRGMLMSSVASGSAERAAIDAGLPIASQDAQTYFQTARDNMEAQNQFALQDQAQGRQLLGQEVDLDFRGQESQMDRGFRREEGAIERNWRSGEASLDRGLQSFMQERGFQFQGDQNALERELRQYMQERGFQFEGSQNALNRELQQFLQENSQRWQSGENALERGFRSTEAQRDRDFTGEQNAAARAQQRFSTWVEQQQRTQELHANMVNAIMTNPNLTPEQQRIALDNLNGWFQRFREAGNAVFAAGVPEIFWNPYQMGSQSPGGQPAQPPGSAPPRPEPQPVIGPIGTQPVEPGPPTQPIIMGP